ncbi:MAG: response regulator [Nitrospinae bacterium]|nr:response regulator [Nitrospinota bacterium]MBL7021321.1 response regulator [Nitrospinaceae bacterium]
MASRLLVADDSTTIQKIVSMAFENEAVEVEGVGDGQEAFDRIADFNPDIVLADVDMPGLNGFELSAKIKESPETSGIKVLLLASDFEDFDEERYKACGANNHISKPFKSDDIVTMVKSLLDSSGDDDVALSETDLEEAPAELTDSEIVEQPDENTEEAAEILGNLKVPEPQEEPSLEELLESVEKLSTDGVEVPDSEGEEEPPEDGTPAVMDRELELPEPVALSADDEILDLPGGDSVEPMEPVELSELQQESFEPKEEPQEPVNSLASDDDIMDQMIRGVEELKESVQLPDSDKEEDEDFSLAGFGSDEPEGQGYTGEPEIFAEIRPRKMDNMDDLDSAFKELSMGGRPAQPDYEEKRPELSSLGGIVPEPEDLLEKIAPGAFSEVGKRPATPEDIKENLDYISGFSDQGKDLDPGNVRSRDWGYEAGEDRFTQAIAEEVKQLLKRSLGTSLEKEVFGLSGAILKTIREVVREVTPEIARRVIREEIEKIKKQDMY